MKLEEAVQLKVLPESNVTVKGNYNYNCQLIIWCPMPVFITFDNMTMKVPLNALLSVNLLSNKKKEVKWPSCEFGKASCKDPNAHKSG